MEQGWDPEVKRYFRKIISSLLYGLLWMISITMTGIYLKLGMSAEKPLYAVILFYAGAAISLFLLLRYYYKTWKK